MTRLALALAAGFLAACATVPPVPNLTVALADARWDGQRIPTGMAAATSTA